MIEFTPLTEEPEYDETKERIGSFFLDSGAHSLYNKKCLKTATKPRGHPDNYGWYEGDEFYQYLDDYAAFIKANQHCIDAYANVDVIFHPEKTWASQKYLENEHGLNPVPVVHYETDLRWLRKYIKAGYEYIGIGGIGQGVTSKEYTVWGDEVFRVVCPADNKRLPIVKTHGFAMTAFPLLARYPWYSVDSASWIKSGGYGNLYFPHKRGDEFTFRDSIGRLCNPHTISVSTESKNQEAFGKHVTTYNKRPRTFNVFMEWLDFIGIPWGEVDDEGNMVEWGVLSSDKARYIANQRFFLFMVDWLPEYPWRFSVTQVRGNFGL